MKRLFRRVWFLALELFRDPRPGAPLSALHSSPSDDDVLEQILLCPAHFSGSPGIGLGADLLMSTDGGSTYNSLGSIVDVIDAGEAQVQDVEAPYLQQANASIPKIPGLVDEGKLKCKIYWNATQYSTARTNLRGRLNGSGVLVNCNFKVVWNDKITSAPSNEVFAGYISKIGKSIPIKDNQITDLEITISGQPTFTAAT